MKRMICAALCGALALGTLGLAGCSGEQERSRYAMTLEYFPETRTLEGEMTADIVNTSDTARETLLFQLWANAYREGAEYRPVSDLFAPAAYYDGASYGGIVVSEVAGASGFRAGWFSTCSRGIHLLIRHSPFYHCSTVMRCGVLSRSQTIVLPSP